LPGIKPERPLSSKPTPANPKPRDSQASAFFVSSKHRFFGKEYTMLMGVVGWIVLGMILGFISNMVVDLRGDDPKMGICLAAIGALIGGCLYSMFSKSPVTSFNPTSLLFAAIAAVVVLLVFHGYRWKAAA
jgi:uncharacterized membrane protein YeaQ/YmgE (transglycosylase-associated protein family)